MPVLRLEVDVPFDRGAGTTEAALRQLGNARCGKHHSALAGAADDTTDSTDMRVLLQMRGFSVAIRSLAFEWLDHQRREAGLGDEPNLHHMRPSEGNREAGQRRELSRPSRRQRTQRPRGRAGDQVVVRLVSVTESRYRTVW